MSAEPMKFGLALPQRGALFGATTIPELLNLAEQAEENELFDAISIGDSLTAKYRPESLTLLGALAARTEKLTLGVACMATFPLRDPLVFAYQWATLDLISNGRMLLGVCTGIVKPDSSEREGAHWGLRDIDRAGRMEENIHICRRLWSEDNVTFTGEQHAFENLTIQPKPVQQPCPIWIAANPSNPKYVERSMKRVAQMADGWMTGNVWPGLFASNWEKLQGYLEAEGRDPASFPTMAVHNFNIIEDREAAFEENSRFLDAYYGPVLPLELKQSWTCWGSPEEVIAGFRQLRQDGAKSLMIRATSWNQQAQFERLVNEVLPYVNEG